MLLNKNKMLHNQLEKIKENSSRLNLQLDYIGWNVKSKNVKITGVPLEKEENTMQLAVKVMKKIDPQISMDNVKSARRLKKKR